MLPDRVSNPGPLTYESGALPIALRGLALPTLKLRSIVKGITVTSLAVYFPFWPHILERNFILFAIHTGKNDYRINWKAKTTKSPSAA